MGTDSCHYYFNPGQYSTFDFYIGLAQFRRPYVPIFRSFSYKNAGFKSKKKKKKNEANTKRKSAETRRIFMPEWHTLPTVNIGLCLHVLRNIKRLLLRRSPDLSFSPDFFSAIKWCYDARNNEKNMSSWVEIYNWTPYRPHPKCYFKFTLNSKFEDHRFGSEKKKNKNKKKKKTGIPFNNGKFSWLIYN